MKKISIKGLVFMAVVLGALFVIVTAIRSNNWTTDYSHGQVKVVSPPPILQIDYSLEGERIHRKGIYIPHGATIKEERFKFDGTIHTRTASFNVTLDGFEPIAILELEQTTYLLTREPFRKQHHCFFQMHPNTKSITHMSIQSVPLPLLMMDFQDQEDGKRFRTWTFNQLVSEKCDSIALSLFHELHKRDNRFLFPKEWTRDRPSRYLFDFLMLYVARQKKVEYYSLLLQSLEASRSSDDPGMIADICYALLELEPVRAQGDVCEFRRRARRENVVNDSRLAIGLKINEHQPLDCDALQPKK